MSEMKLTEELILSGEVDEKKISAKDLDEFIADEGLDVKPGKTKADTLKAIFMVLTGDDDGAGKNSPPDPPAAVSGDPEVTASNYLQRRAKQIAAGRGNLAAITSRKEEDAKKSSYIARRLRKK
jgi:hypothetical protein